MPLPLRHSYCSSEHSSWQSADRQLVLALVSTRLLIFGDKNCIHFCAYRQITGRSGAQDGYSTQVRGLMFLLRAPAVVSRLIFLGSPCAAGVECYGKLYPRLGQPAVAVAARHYRHRLGGFLVLLCLSGQQPHAAQGRRPEKTRCQRRAVGPARRGLLPPRQICRRTAQVARAHALVLLGKLHHLAVWLCAADGVLPVECQYLSGQSGGPHHVQQHRHCGGAGFSGGVLAAVQRHLPHLW